MIWSAWRLNRTPLLVSLGLIAVLTAATLTARFFVLDHPQWTWSFGGICSRWNDVGPCRPETTLTLSTLFALLLPLLFGMFVGVPAFSREVDARVHVLSLTQSRSRAQWYLARVVVVFVPISVAMAGLGLALHWATEPSRDSTSMDGIPSVAFSYFDFPHFETAGVVLGAYTFLMSIVGSSLALACRSGVMAMLATFVVFLFLPVAFTWIARDDYGTPIIESQAIAGLYRESEYPPNPYYTSDGTWVVAAGYVDANGDEVDPEIKKCRQPYPDGYSEKRDGEPDEQRWARMRIEDDARADRFDDCLRAQGVDRFDVHYYTEDSFWRFQGIETGFMLAFASITGAFGLWRTTRLA